MTEGNGRLVSATLGSVEEAWCYDSYDTAFTAMVLWHKSNDNEPTGWHRSVFDGRRRENGDPNKETILW